MKSLLLTAISLLCFSPLSLAQSVWPGDVNNNGIVNEVDLLYLGYAFNKTGSSRASISTEWTAQNIVEEWEDTFPDGLNFVYADCNGDGIVNEMDADVIEANLDTTHTDVPFIADEILLPTSTNINNPKFLLKGNNLSVGPGETVSLQIDFDNPSLLIDSIQELKVVGFSFTLSFNTDYFKSELTEFTENPITWITSTEAVTNKIFLNEEDGKFTIAYTKTDREGIPGTGNIGEVSFVLIDDIIDLLEIKDTVKIAVDSITLVTDDLEKIATEGNFVELDIIGRTTSTYNPILDKIKFYPNPTNGWLLLKSKEVAIEKVELVNTLGQVVYQKQLTNSTFQSLDLQAVPEGMYWLRMITKLGTKSTPVQRL